MAIITQLYSDKACTEKEYPITVSNAIYHGGERLDNKLSDILNEIDNSSETNQLIHESIRPFNVYLNKSLNAVTSDVISNIVNGVITFNGAVTVNTNYDYDKHLLQPGTYNFQMEYDDGTLYWMDTATGKKSKASNSIKYTDPKNTINLCE